VLVGEMVYIDRVAVVLVVVAGVADGLALGVVVIGCG
jgi:hypothetical protein